MENPQYLDEQLLEQYADTFFGFGSYEGDYWFVGMEEGGGEDIEYVAKKIDSWKNRGGLELDDLVLAADEDGYDIWFGERARIQPTWGKYIRVILTASHERASLQSIREYQRSFLGRVGGSNCIIELLPLPSPSIAHWIYSEATTLPQFASREKYLKFYAETRARRLAERIATYHPSGVVFAGLDARYLPWWEIVAGTALEESEFAGRRAYVGRSNHTRFVVSLHPVAFGVSSQYFEEIGRFFGRK